MKKTINIVMFLLGNILSINAQNLVIIGEVENVENGTTFYIEESTGTGSTSRFYKDSDENNGKVIDGCFVLKHKYIRSDSRHFSLYSSSSGFRDDVKLDFWANPDDTVYIKGKGNLLGAWEVKSSAPEQKEWDAICKGGAKELEAHQQAILDYHDYRWYRRDTEMTEAEWDSTGGILAEKDTLRRVTKRVWYKKQLQLMKQLPITDFWMDQLGTILHYAKFYRNDFEEVVKDLYIRHADKIDRKPDGQAVREWVYPYPKAELGKIYKGGELFDIHGKKYHLEDFLGKYVLLDFWAQYCGSCIEAFPQIKKMQEKYADRLVVISISVDKVNTWKASPEQKNITWYSLNDGGGNDGGIAGSFDVRALPTYILIAPDGTYKVRLKSSAIYNGTLEKYLNEN